MLYQTIAKFWRLFVEIIAMFSVAFTVYQFAFDDGKQMVMASMSAASQDLKRALEKIINSLDKTGMEAAACTL
ncbi:MAG: hypothetical protein OCD03_13440 [Hyphomicrobiales bacterium]